MTPENLAHLLEARAGAPLLPGGENPGLLLRWAIGAAAPWLFDGRDRPLHESRAPKAIQERHPWELRRCPYRDIRYHHELPMNMSALRAVMADWEEVLALLWLAGNEYAAERRGVDRLLVACILLGMVPPVAMLRGTMIPEEPMDSALAGALKAVYGFTGLVGDLESRARRAAVSTGAAPELGPAEVYAAACAARATIGTHEVCAGSPQHIERAAAAMLGHDPPSPAAREAAQELLSRLGVSPSPVVECGDAWLVHRVLGEVVQVAAGLLLTRVDQGRGPASDPHPWRAHLPAELASLPAADHGRIVQDLCGRFLADALCREAVSELQDCLRVPDPSEGLARLEATQKSIAQRSEGRFRDHLGLGPALIAPPGWLAPAGLAGGE